MHGEGAKDQARLEMNRQAIERAGLDALVCALPSHVLLLAGYWPVVGHVVAVATPEAVGLVVPEDEIDLAHQSWADEMVKCETGSLKALPTIVEAMQPKLGELLRKLPIKKGGQIGVESGSWTQPASYAAVAGFGQELVEMVRAELPGASVRGVDELLQGLEAVKSEAEVVKTRRACSLVAGAMKAGSDMIRADETETAIAAAMHGPLMQAKTDQQRCDGFAYCMSGKRSAQAYKFYQHTGARKVQSGDVALLHCNSHIDGYWTDVTRTFHLGKPSERIREIYDAVFAAREAALAAIRPGVKAANVDAAARKVMEKCGFARQFKHGLGHGVGFAAMNHMARPRLHPASPDVLQKGMVFNVEPAIYIENECGVRHCDVVACGADGPELLTNFFSTRDQLIVG